MTAFIKTNYISIAFATVLLSAAAYIYSTTAVTVAATALALAYTTAIFLLYDLCRRKQNKWLTCAVAVGGALLSAGLGALMLMSVDGYNVLTGGMWFFQPKESAVYRYPGFTFALVFVFGFFVDTVVYYFTAIRYRRLMLFLACLCPFALFAKTFTDIPVLYSILTVICYFLMMFKQNAGAGGRNGDTVTVNDKGYAITAVMFALTVITIASFFPKIQDAPYREQFDQLITGVQLRGINTAAFGDFADSSSDASSRTNDSELLYTVTSDRPIYLRRQVFDVYNGEEWTYVYGDSYNTGYKGWETAADAYDFELISQYLCTLSDDEELRRYAQSVSTEQMTAAVLKEYNGGARIVLSVAGMNSAEGTGAFPIYRTIKDEYFTETSRSGRELLSIGYYSNSFSEDFSDYLTPERVEELYALAEEKQSGEAGYTAFSRYCDMLREAQQYYDDCVSDYTGQGRVAALAAEITEGCTTDYQKARALEAYFGNGSFVYDLNYSAPTKGVVYFLFESRRGTCSDFATAMALMARSVGLSTRYVEGFSMSEKNDNGDYSVRVSDSHAFPEIFINGRGWVDFEPTIAGADNSGNQAYIVVAIGTAAVISLVVCMAAVLLAPYLKRGRMYRRYRRADERGKIIIAYGGIADAVAGRLGCAAGTLSADDLSETLMRLYGIDARQLCDSYNRAVYGGEAVTCGGGIELFKAVNAGIKNEKREEKRKKRNKKSRQ